MSDTYTLEELKRMAKSLLDRSKTASEEGIENGIKIFNIAFLNLQGTELDKYQGRLLLAIVQKELGVLP